MNYKDQRVAFVVNPIAGGTDKKPFLNAVRGLPSNIITTTVFTKRKGDATTIATSLRNDGWEKIVAVGGDGTFNEVAAALVDTDIPLGIIPLGSGDGLARHLGIPKTLTRAMQWVLTAPEKKIDYGTLNGRPFLKS